MNYKADDVFKFLFDKHFVAPFEWKNLHKQTTRYTVTFKCDNPACEITALHTFEINVIAEVATFAVDSDLSEYSEQQIKSQLSEKFTSKFSDILYSTIKKIQSLNSDALNFNKIFRNKFPQYFKRYEKDRASCCKCFNYTINQTTHIAVTGKEQL